MLALLLAVVYHSYSLTQKSCTRQIRNGFRMPAFEGACPLLHRPHSQKGCIFQTKTVPQFVFVITANRNQPHSRSASTCIQINCNYLTCLSLLLVIAKRASVVFGQPGGFPLLASVCDGCELQTGRLPWRTPFSPRALPCRGKLCRRCGYGRELCRGPRDWRRSLYPLSARERGPRCPPASARGGGRTP